ncbi:hypothetical protein [Nitratidesulfovibrio vulgaris]|jgi:hypothetical protein|uniref:Uncharacterized protein n=2 Tax=Nitratidesulfovibrio vulgaris TaxID=881 RepID=Q72AZ5_NITV2|nr:hypothetical protein [Nitratidesulfovibrio vulgaris]GEB79504.1 hypothetical protein DDE01_09190 [Desulfovibrio desulfuricans]HBW16448.1 hypothetical protein [Desulfovibrio sp.]AAS96321.1 hypothetical protein DVU_1845 [Nitratidesulfovibrio vulgaris str. Hildenborough]ABM28335.1 conserved hypothetical protein [Nitratidesulfovibrio vulgaris DP4]ADP86615.1 hypothetical protein Deval_1460 [Nitratidesulfovibrio vulgaris RCH1]
MRNDGELHSRLKNCLQTILDLEPDIGRYDASRSLMREFTMLKAFMERLEDMLLAEDDVRRIERATTHFLEELRGSMATMQQRTGRGRLLQ